MKQLTKNQIALIKLVRERKMILQADAAHELNKSSINQCAKVLSEQGKFKRQAVKVRGRVGNLTDQYLLYHNDIKQTEILEYEKELVNRPFKSPLEDRKNHWYFMNKDKQQEQSENIEVIPENNNVVDMQEYVRINNTDLKIKQYKGERVVTIKEVAEVHNKPIKAVNQQLERNKDKLIKDVDYFVISKEESKVTGCDFKNLFTSNRQKEIYLITEMGYLMLVKSFNDDLSWQVQRQLVNSYFKVKQLKEEENKSTPAQQYSNFNGTYDIIKLFASGITDLNERVKMLENTIDGFKKAVSN
jgi:hypothetical protein